MTAFQPDEEEQCDLDEYLDEEHCEEDEHCDEVEPGPDRSAPVEEATPGCAVSFYVDNKLRHGVCLAVIGDELLFEHKRGDKCLLFTGKVAEIVPRIRLGVASATIIVGKLKPCRYRSVPKKWLQQMVQTGQSWKGIEGDGKVAPHPSELLRGQMELF